MSREPAPRTGASGSSLLGVLGRKGVRVACSQATMYVWVAVPGGDTSEGFAGRLLDHGVLVAPGLVPRPLR